MKQADDGLRAEPARAPQGAAAIRAGSRLHWYGTLSGEMSKCKIARQFSMGGARSLRPSAGASAGLRLLKARGLGRLPQREDAGDARFGLVEVRLQQVPGPAPVVVI